MINFYPSYNEFPSYICMVSRTSRVLISFVHFKMWESHNCNNFQKHPVFCTDPIRVFRRRPYTFNYSIVSGSNCLFFTFLLIFFSYWFCAVDFIQFFWVNVFLSEADDSVSVSKCTSVGNYHPYMILKRQFCRLQIKKLSKDRALKFSVMIDCKTFSNQPLTRECLRFIKKRKQEKSSFLTFLFFNIFVLSFIVTCNREVFMHEYKICNLF